MSAQSTTVFGAALLRAALKAYGLTAKELAARLGVTKQRTYSMISDKATGMNEPTFATLGHAIGIGPEANTEAAVRYMRIAGLLLRVEQIGFWPAVQEMLLDTAEAVSLIDPATVAAGHTAGSEKCNCAACGMVRSLIAQHTAAHSFEQIAAAGAASRQET